MSLKELILDRIQNKKKFDVWTPSDFLDLSNREAIDKVLQRLAKAGNLRRISRGLYDLPKSNKLTGKITTPDYQKIIDAVQRREQIRILIDGLTAANDLGLTNMVPGQIKVLTDGRLASISIQNLEIKFQKVTPRKLYWADKKSMRIVQALHWLKDVINTNAKERELIKKKTATYIKNSEQKIILMQELQDDLYTLPNWMQTFLKEMFASADMGS
jgi:predicted transcriptional regulator of viral defense system